MIFTNDSPIKHTPETQEKWVISTGGIIIQILIIFTSNIYSS